jgi:hypothetical protein
MDYEGPEDEQDEKLKVATMSSHISLLVGVRDEQAFDRNTTFNIKSICKDWKAVPSNWTIASLAVKQPLILFAPLLTDANDSFAAAKSKCFRRCRMPKSWSSKPRFVSNSLTLVLLRL